ncbi:oligoendopeptidase F [Metamycoplasma neophronis]|uniref:Oligopeptidase F n=1 Tax=Metamycoplasma neophronis TaxID=872983 RepID=A0ABY2Z5J8_9BACT|nr:oligoendopeptidase F [Metamycoplasma neophronis]TPR54299.1 oligoendopeptidase F [Metamycoplasma neophronis]
MAKIKKFNSYSEVDENLKWDLDDILGSKTYQELEDEYFKLYDIIIKVKDSKYETLKNYEDYLKVSAKMAILGNKVSNYLSNKLNTNIVDFETNTLLAKFDSKSAEYAKKLGSETNRIAQHRAKIESWLNEPVLSEVKKDLQATLDELDHKLDDAVETYLNDTANGNPSPEELFSVLTDSEIDYGFATDSKGKKHKITEGTRLSLLKSNDALLRKETYLNYSGAYLKHKQSLSKMLYQHIKEISVQALYRKYSSSLDSILSADHVDKKLLEIIYSSVQNNMEVFRKYHRAHKQFFKAKFGKKMEKWDGAVDLVKVKSEYSVEEAQQILIDITSVMPYEYPEVVKKAVKERWVDYMNVPSKRSGAYSIGGSYGLDKKYILMNFDGTLNAVGTLCHEMGHSMHSYYSDKNQSVFRSQYPIFLAEIASIFNELLLNDYLIERAKSDEEKFYLLSESIGDFIGTVLRQTQWSNYEFELYNMIDQNEPMNTYEALEKLYVDNAKKYSMEPEQTKMGEPANVYGVMVPHFYYYFYVYKYALGYIVANVFFQKYKEEGKPALENYVNRFLSAGDRDWPAQILKDAGVDIYSPDIYNQAFKVLDEKVNAYVKLGKKIFKK